MTSTHRTLSADGVWEVTTSLRSSVADLGKGKMELEALAARCESEGPSWDLSIAIELAIVPGAIDRTWDGLVRVGVGDRAYNPPSYTTSLDAAVTLVPKATYGGKLGPMTVSAHQADDGAWWCEIRDGWQTSFGKAYIGVAKTEAMARCAAALHARAAILAKSHSSLSALEGEGK